MIHQKSNLKRNWIWDKNQSIIAAGGLYSDAIDLLDFLKIHLKEKEEYTCNTHKIIGKGLGNYQMRYGRKINNKDNITWHNGGTGVFNTFMGFNPNNKRVVSLSNYRSLVIDRLGLSLLK